jgi:hypothetical protein
VGVSLMGEIDLISMIAYSNIMEKIIESGLLENVTGDVYISHEELHYVLGLRCKIHSSKQMKIIKELYDNKYIMLTPAPMYLDRKVHQSERFYIIKKEIVQRIKQT